MCLPGTGGGSEFILPNGGTALVKLTGIANSINGSGGTNRLPSFGRNSFVQRRTQVLDLRLSKRFQIRDNATLELLGESFNLANHHNVTSVTKNAYSYTRGTAATSTSAATPNTLTYNTPFGTANNGNSNLAYSPRQLGVRVQF